MMRTIFATLLILFQLTTTFGQSRQAVQSDSGDPSNRIIMRQIQNLPRPQRKPPKITLQQALKIAETYIKKNKIAISDYYLFQVKWMLYGTDVKEPRWYFWWVNNDGALGHYVELTVSMDGAVTRLGSM